jgi:hypothetical protein
MYISLHLPERAYSHRNLAVHPIYFASCRILSAEYITHAAMVEIAWQIFMLLTRRYAELVLNSVVFLYSFLWRTASQRLRKHIPTRNNRWSCVFYVVCATQQYGGCVFCAWSVPKVYNRHGESFGAVEFRSSKGAVVWPEVVEGIRLRQEDLVCDYTCAVVQWYWECVI